MTTVSAGLAGKTILVIEDEYFIASDLKRALIAAGATVVGPVGGLAEGRALAAAHELHAAVLDVNLEGAMTYPLADDLVARGIPILFVTGYDDWAMPEAYRATPRIAKPFNMEGVLDAIAGLIAEEKK